MLIALITMLLSANPAKADCLKLNTEGLKKVVHESKTYYSDPQNTYLLSSGCVKADASAAEVKLRLKKSGRIETLGEQRIAHTVQAQGATVLTIFDFGPENGQVTGVSGKLSPSDIKKIVLQRIK